MTLYRKDDTNAFEQNFIEIELENAFGIEITKAEFRCGQVLKSFESPLFPLKIDLSSDETEKLSYTNTCYLAIYDEKGRKRTCEGSLTFPTKGGGGIMNELKATFALEEQEPIRAIFKINLTPYKLSQFENDMGFVRKEEINLPDVDFDDLATKQEVENISTQKVDISDFENVIDDINEELETKQPKGDYALTSDIPDISNLATKNEIPTDYATKSELEAKQDTLTAGENITIENGVISANVPQSGGGTVEIKTTAPIVYGGSEATTSTDNISTDDYGKNYLNSNAYFATADEFLPSDPSSSINRDSKTLYDVRAEYDSVFLQFLKCSGYGESYPQINLSGYNAMLRKFELGDIVVGDATGDYDGVTRFQMVFGNLGEDNTFIPKLVAKTFCWDGGGLGFFTQLLKPRTSFKGGDNNGPTFFEIDYDNYPDKVNYITLAETGAGRDYCGVKFVDRNGRVGLNWIKRDGTEVETNSGSFNLEDLEINCVLFNNYCYSGELVDSSYRGFNAENFFISNGSYDNVVVRMVDGSANTERRIGLKYNTDDFEVVENKLSLKTKIRPITEAEFEALENKDSNTLYLIEE